MKKNTKALKIKYTVLFINKLKAIKYVMGFFLLFIYYLFFYPSF